MQGTDIGKAFNLAKSASAVCERQLENVTDLRNSAKNDFRISTCREAIFAGMDFANGQAAALSAPSAENAGKLETLSSGYASMAESCRNPDSDLLAHAVGRGK